MQRRARREIECNPRFCWLGELPRWQTIKRLARSRLLVVTSKLEGGANVLSEAIVASVPVLSSRISGSMGLLGDDYPGYFEVGDTRALARLLERAETDCRFYETLASRCERLRPLLDPANECRAWQGLLEELAYTSRRPGRHKKQ